jgi:hypothetical protein
MELLVFQLALLCRPLVLVYEIGRFLLSAVLRGLGQGGLYSLERAIVVKIEVEEEMFYDEQGDTFVILAVVDDVQEITIIA